MKTTELFVEPTLTGFLILTAGAAPFLPWETLQKLPDEASGGIDIRRPRGRSAQPTFSVSSSTVSRIRSSPG
jgi:hypothetical protein